MVALDLNIWFTGDLHIGHAKIIKYCNRPFGNVELMDAELITRWNQKIKADDLVIVVGDFIFGRHLDAAKIIPTLNGQIILIKGSHDKPIPPIPWVPYMFMKIGKYNCLINHRPIIPRGAPDPYRDNDPHLSMEILAQAERVICGHVHEKWLRNGPNYNVGVDQHNYYPISLAELTRELGNE